MPPPGDLTKGEKSLEDIFTDAEFWEITRQVMTEAVRPIFYEAYMVGAELGSLELEPTGVVDPDKVQVSLGFRAIPFDRARAAIIANQFIAGYTDSWWRQFSVATQNGIRHAITRSARDGTGLAGVLAGITPLFGAERAQLIAVSETTNLMGGGAQETYRQAGYEHWEWRTSRDSRVDGICRKLDKKKFPMSVKFERAHPGCRCLVPGQRVLVDGITKGMRRRYEGQVVTLKTAFGHELTVTPNHPVATPSGWLAAGDLHEGDELFSDRRWTESLAGDVPNNELRPALVEDVFDAVAASPEVITNRVESTAVDFHGDGGHGDIDVVSAAGPLGMDGQVARDQFGTEVAVGSAGNAGCFAGQRTEAALAIGRTSPSRRPVSVRDIPVAVTPSVPRGVTAIAQINLSSAQPIHDRVARDAEPPRQFVRARTVAVRGNELVDINRSHIPRSGDPALPKRPIEDSLRDAGSEDDVERIAPFVHLDRVVSISSRHYEGPVYNFETTSGWYTGAGIAVHNCWPVPAGQPRPPTTPFLPVESTEAAQSGLLDLVGRVPLAQIPPRGDDVA